MPAAKDSRGENAPFSFYFSCYIEPRLPRGGVYPPLVHTVERRRTGEKGVRFPHRRQILPLLSEGIFLLFLFPASPIRGRPVAR